MIDEAIDQLTPLVGTTAALAVVGADRATWYRHHRQSPAPVRPERVATAQPRALSAVERKEIKATLESDEFVDEAPATVYAKLLDQGTYLASVSTMYRVLHEHDEVRERRRQATHPAHKKPELIATGPNSVWSWDITKLHGPEKWTYYYLYVILDIYSRYAVGWMLARAEQAELSKRLINETILKQGVAKDQLTIHSDRGSPMIAKGVAHLLADLGVTKSLSRPHVSNDNPYSESQFRTFKYRPDFPDRFGSFEHGQSHCARFFHWSRRSSSFGHWTSYPRRCPLRPGRSDPRTTWRRPSRRLCQAPRAIRPQDPHATGSPRSRLDQSTRKGGHRLTKWMKKPSQKG
jgi:putative transposase